MYEKFVADTSFVAPARVNLLGEHTDYTGGLVLPIAVPFFTRATIGPCQDGHYSFTSEIFPEIITFPIGDRPPASGKWSDYPIGVLRQIQQRGVEPAAFYLHLSGDVPLSAGLSSSASVEVASALAMLAISRVTLSSEEIALLCRNAENEYVHSPCGIMDQFAIMFAQADHALLLDTGSLKYEHIPMDRGGLARARIIVCNSMVKHSIATGEYGIRRRESEEGQSVLLQSFPELRDLGDASLEHLETAKELMSAQAYRRCRHIIGENVRVRQAVLAMLAGDPVALGQLMLEGHASERDDFECSCDEIEYLVTTASALRGCFGARLTGGGFGGCTANLVEESQCEAFTIALKRMYQQRFGIIAETYLCDPIDGAALCNQQKAQL